MMPLKIMFTPQFKHDMKVIRKRHLDEQLLKNIVDKLAKREELPISNYDHPLKGKWYGYRECHIQPDWLLIYKIHEDTLTLALTRTGSHSDLF